MGDGQPPAGNFLWDTGTFEELVGEHYNSLFLLCLHYTRDADAANDLVQDSVLSALLKLESLKDEARFGSWLSAIALNHCRRWSRHERRHRRLDGEELALVDGALSPEDASMSRETEEFVSAGIAQLSPAHQQVVRMFYLEDRSLKQMATSLGLAVQAANQRLYRARLRLKEELGIMVTQQNWPLALREFAKSESAATLPWPPADHMNLDSLRGLERVHDDTCVALSTTLSGHAARARTGGEARGLARVRVPVPTQGEPAEALPYLPEI